MPVTARPYDYPTISAALKQVGWSIAVKSELDAELFAAIKAFQKGWTPTDLVVDGWAGPITCDALNWCVGIGGHCSAHFAYREFASKGNGDIRVNRTLVRALEKLRAAYYPSGLVVVSGYRDPAYNASVGGVGNSQHLYGAASDIPKRCTVDQVQRLGVFSGIGYRAVDGLVVHADVRGQDGAPATTAGTTTQPSWWVYE